MWNGEIWGGHTGCGENGELVGNGENVVGMVRLPLRWWECGEPGGDVVSLVGMW